uniref:SH3 domain-containing protein n=1 Tax=Loxodonta africana TaxID=9785 RepID=G3U5I3_LOXAF
CSTLPDPEGASEAMEVLVLAGYRAQKEDELSLAPEDVVRQVRQGPGARGWLRGRGDRCGLFPQALVQEIPENLVGSRERPNALRGATETVACWRARGSRVSRAALLPRRPGTAVACDWFLSTMLRYGAGPGGTEGCAAACPSPSSADWGTRRKLPHSRPTPGHPAESRGPQRWCKVNFNYNPEQADELKLQAGEIVEVLKEIEDGWWLGQKNGQLGAFPSNFVELLDSGPPSEISIL